MFGYRMSKHPYFNEACRNFALRHFVAVHGKGWL